MVECWLHSSVYWKLLFVAKNTDKTELVFTLMEFTSQLGWAAMYPFPCNSAKLTLSLRSETTYQWIKRYFIYIITNLTLLQCSQKSSWLKDLRTAKNIWKHSCMLFIRLINLTRICWTRYAKFWWDSETKSWFLSSRVDILVV